jgi:hypothetical protein
MFETVKLEPGWLVQETQKASERFAERLKRDFGILGEADWGSSDSDVESTSQGVKDESDY